MNLTLKEFREHTKNLPDNTLLCYPVYDKGCTVGCYQLDALKSHIHPPLGVFLTLRPGNDYDGRSSDTKEDTEDQELATVFSVDGYWKKDGQKFHNYYATDSENTDFLMYYRRPIVFRGLSEEDIKESIKDGLETVRDFVFTHYRRVGTELIN